LIKTVHIVQELNIIVSLNLRRLLKMNLKLSAIYIAFGRIDYMRIIKLFLRFIIQHDLLLYCLMLIDYRRHIKLFLWF